MHGTYINVVIKNNAAPRAMTFAYTKSEERRKKKHTERRKQQLQHSNKIFVCAPSDTFNTLYSVFNNEKKKTRGSQPVKYNDLIHNTIVIQQSSELRS